MLIRAKGFFIEKGNSLGFFGHQVPTGTQVTSTATSNNERKPWQVAIDKVLKRKQTSCLNQSFFIFRWKAVVSLSGVSCVVVEYIKS